MSPAALPRKVRVKVPATTSNLGPGFDVLGMALKLHNEVEVETLAGSNPVSSADIVEIEGEGASTLPKNNSNILVAAVKSLLPRSPVRVRAINRIPLARGLGSSAAARLAGLLAAHALAGRRETARGGESLLEAACRMEGHPDNVVPAYHGGLSASLQDGPTLRVCRLDAPEDLAAVVCVPDFELSTEKARKALPRKVPRRDAVANAARLAFLIQALGRREYGWLKFAMQDCLHQPYRKPLVPGMDRVIQAAVRAGAYGAALSGSGPSMLALAPRGPRGPLIGRAMRRAFAGVRVESKVHVLDIERDGAAVKVLA